MNNLKLKWERFKLAVKFNFALSDEEVVYVDDKHKGLGKTTYLVKQCKKYNLGLVVGSQLEKQRIIQEFNFRNVYTMEEVKRYPHSTVHEFLVDDTVGLGFLNKYYLHTHPKIRVIGGFVYLPSHW